MRLPERSFVCILNFNFYSYNFNILVPIDADFTNDFMLISFTYSFLPYNYIVRCGDSTITSGSFLWDSSDMFMFGFAVGGRFNDTGFLNGEISSLEIYHVNETSKPFPECLKNLVINNHVMKDVNPPSSKKSRVN